MPIDYVVPMVFPDDMSWRHELQNLTGPLCRDDARRNERYRTWGTEEILIKLIRKNLPWIRCIHILLARRTQVQPWMKEMAGDGQKPEVRLVLHQDFMPKDKLPTFNSRAIEMYLHKIPDLAPLFLYGNDDMFPLSPLPASDFFQPSREREGSAGQGSAGQALAGQGLAVPSASDEGFLPCLHLKTKEFPPLPNQYHWACLNGLNFVARNFGQEFHRTWLHTGHSVAPMLRQTIEMFWQRWPEEMERSVTQFRQVQNFNQYIYLWWHCLSGQYVDHHPPRDYVATNRQTPDEIRQAIRQTESILCINDHTGADDLGPYAEAAREELQKRLEAVQSAAMVSR